MRLRSGEREGHGMGHSRTIHISHKHLIYALYSTDEEEKSRGPHRSRINVRSNSFKFIFHEVW
jgi:hypothetical protein